MTPQFQQLYNEATEKLGQRRLAEAISALQGMTSATPWGWKTLDELERINSAYGLLLRYMKQGVNDPERQRQHLNFIASAYMLAERAAREAYIKEKSVRPTRTLAEITSDIERLEARRLTSQPSRDDEEMTVKLYTELFHCARNSEIWNADMQEVASSAMRSALIPAGSKAVMISGLMLSCLYFFDPQKIIFFANQYAEATDVTSRMRLLIAAVLPVMKFNDRLFAFPAIEGRFKLLLDTPNFTSDLTSLQILLLESLSTHDVNKRLRDEILPAMLKSRNFNPLKFGIERTDDAGESNPEWGSLDKKIHELADLEIQGADVYYSTFSSLKHFSFFTEEANWFLPYYENHPDIPSQVKANGNGGIMSALLGSDALCDSDKYSLCMLTMQMSQEQLSFLASQMPEVEAPQQAEPTRESACRNLLRDLFRYFYLYAGDKPANPFETNLLLLDTPTLSRALRNHDSLSAISAYALSKKNYHAAETYLKMSDEMGVASEEEYQKLGFCCQKTGKYHDAVAYYAKAYALGRTSVWTLRHLAQANLLVGNYEEALKYYRMLPAGDTAEARTAFRCGECLVRLERYDEALREFFKSDYLSPGNLSASRAIAWCSVLTGKIPQARKYYGKIIAAEPRPDDYVNAGHAAWIDGDMQGAASLYSHTSKSMEPDDFCRKFEADTAVLATYNISEEDMRLMEDLIIMTDKEN